MMSECLSKREIKWVFDAATNGKGGENTIDDFLKGLPSKYKVECRVGNMRKVPKPKPAKGYFVLDISIINTETGLSILLEVKFQHARGNAHERAYKYAPYSGIAQYIKNLRKQNYYPVITIFTGEMASTPKYVDEINIAYGNAPGSAFLFDGTNIDDFTSFIQDEVLDRIDGIKTDDYSPEIMQKRNNDFIAKYSVMSNDTTEDKISIATEENEDNEQASDADVEDIIKQAGNDGITKGDIEKELEQDPTKAIRKFTKDGSIVNVGKARRGSKWAWAVKLNSTNLVRQDQTIQQLEMQ